MENLQVIRIENKQGVGCFVADENKDAYSLIPDACDRHFVGKDSYKTQFPTPRQENLNLFKDGYKWFCAFKSIKQLNKLFLPNEIKTLIENEFDIYLLTVSNYQKGRKQIIFTKESIITKENINSLFV